MKMKYTDLKQEDIDSILVRTTSKGPFEEDVFFLVIAKGDCWEVPNSLGKEFLDWLAPFPNVDFGKFIESMGCTEDRIFTLYQR